MKKISVIIPVYNASLYLEKCLKSILTQSLTDIEVIAIDDGSTDDSLEILKKISLQDQRLIVISQSNQGQGKARNVGIERACGQTITFCDSDDYLDNREIYNEMYKRYLEDQSDLVVAGAKIIDLSNKEKVINFEKDEVIDIEKNEEDFYLNWYQDARFMVSCWNKLYKTEIIQTEKILFNDYNKVFSEDTLFNYRYIAECKKISILHTHGYTQIMRRGSSSTTLKKNDVPRYINMIDEMANYSRFKKSGYYSDVCLRYILTSIDTLILVSEYHNGKIDKKTIFEITKQINNSKIRGLLPDNFPVKRKVFRQKETYYRLLFSLQKRNSYIIIGYLQFAKVKLRNFIDRDKNK